MVASHTSKILLVDDERESCAVLEDFLKGEGYKVCSAFDGLEALEVFRKFNPDLVLMDIRMPRMNGLATLQTIQKVNPTPVIMLTAVGEMEIVQKCLESGAKEYLMKPIDLDRLEKAIVRILKIPTPVKAS